jgi:uncharacterized sulfatase
VRDVGFMPEYELHRDEDTTSAYERGHDPAKYDFDRVYRMAQQASDRRVALDVVRPGLSDRDPIVRYWAATGVLIRGREAVSSTLPELQGLLADPEPGPQIVAAEAIARFGPADGRQAAFDALLARSDASRNHEFVAMFALYSLNQVRELPEAVRQAVQKLPKAPTTTANHITQRENYLPKSIDAVVSGVR